VTLWEILTMARHQPYEHLALNQQVVDHLSLLKDEEEDQFERLPKPAACPRDLYDLMNECWRRVDVERPSFREIHLFLQRKNLGYAPM
jgi:discoidin domain receptor family member 2